MSNELCADASLIARRSLLCIRKLITLRAYEHTYATECKVVEFPRLPRELRQQRADAGQHLGLFPRLRNPAAANRDAGRDQKLSGHLPEPAAGESAARPSAAKYLRLRGRLRRDQARPAHGPAGTGSLDKLPATDLHGISRIENQQKSKCQKN